MSAAPQLTRSHEARIGATALPPVRTAPRAAQRKRISLKSVVALGSLWAVFMFLSLSLVQTNSAIRAANIETNRARSEIDRQEMLSRELEGKIASAASMAEVERWAMAKGMEPPTGLVETLPGKEEAVAVRTPAAPAPAEDQAAQENQPFWQSLLARITGSSNQAAGVQR